MISKILRNTSSYFRSCEAGSQALHKLRDLQKDERWKVYQGLLVSVANDLSMYLMSKEFTQKDAETKDREQWAIFMFRELMEFAINPLAASEQRAAIQRHNKKMEETAKGSTGKAKK